MESILKTLGGASTHTYGLAIAVVLLLAIAVLLPSKDRRLIRQPSLFLLAHLVFRGLLTLVDSGSDADRILGLLSQAALLATIGRASVVLLMEVILNQRLKADVPKIIRDIVQGFVYVGVLLVILRAVGFEPGQLLTTSALLTAVVGLSMQDTLGNLVAGLAVQLQRPFDLGDWIQYDDEQKHMGRVVEINWRATRLVTLDNVEIVVPNGLLAKAALKNYSKPTPIVRRSVMVQAGFDVPPERVHDVILRAIEDAPGVSPQSAPSVVTLTYREFGVEYWVRFHTDQFRRRDLVDGGVRDRIWYAFQRNGIRLPYPRRAVDMRQLSEETQARDVEDRIGKRERALESIDILAIITAQQRRELALRARTLLFSPGEVIVKQGDQSDEMFLIEKGEVAVLLESERSEPTEVTRLSRGMFFGEMALVTGEARKATVRAVDQCELLVIDHDAFEGVLRQNPAVIEQLGRVLVERQMQLREHAATSAEADDARDKTRSSTEIIGRIKSWFRIS